MTQQEQILQEAVRLLSPEDWAVIAKALREQRTQRRKLWRDILQSKEGALAQMERIEKIAKLTSLALQQTRLTKGKP